MKIEETKNLLKEILLMWTLESDKDLFGQALLESMNNLRFFIKSIKEFTPEELEECFKELVDDIFNEEETENRENKNGN